MIEVERLDEIRRGVHHRTVHAVEGDLPGARLAVPSSGSFRLWFPRRDRLWVSDAGTWTLWGLEGDTWHRLAAGQGVLACHPPLAMGLVTLGENDQPVRQTSALDRADWQSVPAEQPAPATPTPVADVAPVTRASVYA